MSTSGSTVNPNELLFVRHGESRWNAAGLIQGQSLDAPGLTELGKWQAEHAAASIGDLTVDRLISSDLVRARETALPFATRFGLEPELEPRLRERALGVAQGQPASSGLHLAGLQGSLVVDPEARPEGGESLRELFERVAGFIAEMRMRPAGRVVCVTHGGVVRVASAIAHHDRPETMRWSEVDNATIFRVSLS